MSPPIPPRTELLEKLLSAAQAAGEIVMRVYAEEDVGAELKGPNDPVTRADREANVLLLEHLTRDFPGVPIVAEESDPALFKGFGNAPAAFFVDPVDGTREFIAKNGEFCVMIGYAEEGRATAGIVLLPALGQTYLGAEGVGAFVIDAHGKRTPVHVSNETNLANCRVAVSRFQRSKSLDAKLTALGAKELVTVGSAGLKGVKVASGELEMFAHPSQGRVKLWDACAPDAVVRAAGGILTDGRGVPFDYRGEVDQGQGLLGSNSILHAQAVERFRLANSSESSSS